MHPFLELWCNPRGLRRTNAFCSNGSMFVNNCEKSSFPCDPNIIWIMSIQDIIPIKGADVVAETFRAKVFKFSICYGFMAINNVMVNTKFTINVNKTVVTNAYVRDPRTNNSIRPICKYHID